MPKATVIGLMVLAPLLLLGCSREPGGEAPPATATTTPARQPSAPESTATANGGSGAAILSELTQAVRKYGAEQRRVPKDLNELVAAGYLPGIPAAPAGTKFAIDKQMQVYLADQ
jgi:hypothetical protein